jgi:AbrB family looped-hinge helix DNA binding protein
LAFMMANAILNGMTLKIDPAGRVILPKPIRDRLGLTAGADLEVEEAPGEIILRPVQQQPSLVKRDGVLIHRGKLPKGYDWNRLVEDDREERLRKLAAT